jgi:hypothetical protein
MNLGVGQMLHLVSNKPTEKLKEWLYQDQVDLLFEHLEYKPIV